MPDTPADLDQVADQFRGFAVHRAGSYAPLYARLAEAIAEDRALLAVAALARPGQSRPDLLLAAIRDLLLTQPDHPATRLYPDLSDHPDTTGDPAPAVLRFAHEHRSELAKRVATRLVQTNEARRAVFLTAALHAMHAPAYRSDHLCDRQPLALIEVGASAGLCLIFDRYHYRYHRPGHSASDPGVTLAGTPGAPVLTCELRGPLRPPLHPAHPAVAWRAGLDLNPLDPTNPHDRRWLRALSWPDHPTRAARLNAALDLAALDPPHILAGDATDHLPTLVQIAPIGAHLVIYHCAVLAHMTPADRRHFTDTVTACSRDRPLSWIQAEPRPDADPRRLRLTHCADGRVIRDLPLGHYQPHGEWLHWTHTRDHDDPHADPVSSVVRS